MNEYKGSFDASGKRFALPNARIMIHQPWGGVQGQASDISIQAKEILRLRERLNEILAKHTGKTIDTITKDTDRDRFLSADEAKEYGLIDPDADNLRITQVVWCSAHGISRLMIDGVYVHQTTLDAICNATVDALVDGLASGS